MRCVLAIALLALLARAQESDVLVLTDETYAAAIKENPIIMIEFYAPWCGHCKSLAPEYEKAATALKGVAVVAKIDATENNQAAQENGIQGFPTLRLFLNGKPIEYNSQRTADAIVAFIKKATLPAISVLKTAEEVAKFKEDNAAALIAYFANVDETAEAADGVFNYAAFKAASEAGKMSSSVAFAVATNAADIAVEGEAAVLFRKADSTSHKFDAASYKDPKSLLSWSGIFSLLPLDQVGPQNFQRYFESGLPLFWLVLDPAADNAAVMADVEKLAREFVGKVLFFWMDNTKFGGQTKHIGLSGQVVPAAVITSETGKFPWDESKPLVFADLHQFVEDVLAGKVEASIKSGKVPEDNEQRNVFELVAKNYKANVEDSEKDVVVEFFAEYCGHCKALAPIYEEAGRLLKSVPSLLISRINVPDNDIKQKIKGFPTIMLFPAGDKQAPIEYEGDRTLPSLLKFIQEKAKTPFELPEEAAKIIADAEKPAEGNEEAAQEQKDEL